MRAIAALAAILAAAFALIATTAEAAIDLSAASVERLDNGLTLIMLEDRTFPVVSVQTAYRTGAKDDPAGRLGLAHFFEHMAFRGSKNFPDLGLTSEIYAVGGEWHGYTWIDNTNYFATVPKDELPLLLDIDADRMARLELRKEDIEAERGAVLAEMNGYANDPDSTLFDALMAAHFLTHPYRNNTIGYASDISAITHEDVVDFYERNYAPQNAILAIVGDFDREAVRALVKKKFGKIRKKIRRRAPLTPEIPRTGERRVTISAPSDEKLFKIAYPAPAASHPDFPAFLVLQALIGESSGVNFNQNDWGTPVYSAFRSVPKADQIRTWFIPTAQTYAAVISGAARPGASETEIENAVQSALDKYAEGEFLFPSERDPDADAELNRQFIDTVKDGVAAALEFDLESTEDAAHQLAYFASIGALDQFLTLEGNLAAITADDVARIAAKYLRKDQRTIAWLKPGSPTVAAELDMSTTASDRDGAPTTSTPISKPLVLAPPDHAPVIFQQSTFSETVTIKALLAGRYDCAECAVDMPAFGLTTFGVAAAADRARDILDGVSDAIPRLNPVAASALSSDDPLTRLEEIFASTAQPEPAGGLLAVGLSGVVGNNEVKRFSNELPQAGARPNISIVVGEDRDIFLDEPKAQHAVGYAAAAPAADSADALAMQVAVYVLSHGYAGRLGVEAISRRGLAYYIDAQYRAGIGSGLVTLAAGVDPDKVDAFRDLMKSEIARLKTEPPTDAEIAEAKRHLLGRKISAAQSNDEIAGALIRDFLAVGRPESADEFAARLEKITREDVLNAVEALQKGAVVTVRGAGVE
jgi:zinc protease